MSDSSPQEAGIQAEDAADTPKSDLVAQLELLSEENERLRQQYASVQQTRYRRVALGLATIGGVAVLGGALVPSARSVLLILGATGLFGALLTYYLTPERFIAADVGERVYAPLARNESQLAAELGLTDIRVYVPDGTDHPAWLYVPQYEEYERPSTETLQSVLVVEGNERSRGLSLAPTGEQLFRDFERSLTGTLASSPADLVTQIIDGLVEGFELIKWAESDIDAAAGRLSIHINDSAYGGGERFDEPVTSFIAVALARGLECPIRVETTTQNADEYVVTCYWETEMETDTQPEEARSRSVGMQSMDP